MSRPRAEIVKAFLVSTEYRPRPGTNILDAALRTCSYVTGFFKFMNMYLKIWFET